MSKLVIIDDDPVHHFLMRYTLSNNNYFDTTTFTMDGSTVLEYIEENKSHADKLPDIIFLGLNRPSYTGWDFLDSFQQLYRKLSKNIEVYVLTSSVWPADKDRTAKYPFIKSLINKPLALSTINQISREIN